MPKEPTVELAAPEKTVDLSFRAVVVKAERNGQIGVFRAVLPDQQGNLVLDLSSVMPGDRVRDVQIDDYAEISIRIRKKDVVEAEAAAQGEPPAPEQEQTEETPAKRTRHLRAVA